MTKKFLLIDDSRAITEILSMYLESEFDYEMVECHSSLHAIKILENDLDIELVVCDFNMPFKKGDYIYQKIKDLGHPGKIIFCTAEDPEELKKKSSLKSWYCENYPTLLIEKPFEQEEVIKKVKEVFQLDEKKEGECCYKRVSVGKFLIIHPSFSDTYIEGPQSKDKVKLWSKGEDIGPKDLGRLLLSENDYVYLRDDDYQSFTQRLIERFQSQYEQDQKKISFSWEDKEQLYQDLHKWGISEFVLNHIEKEKDHISDSLLSEDNFPEGHDLKDLKENYKNQLSHLTMTFALELLMISPFDWGEFHSSIMRASILQDLYLDNPVQIKIYDLNKSEFLRLKSEDRDAVIEHPRMAMELAKSFNSRDQVCEKLIFHHHIRPDGGGFPNDLGEGELLPISGLYNLAHEWARQILKGGPNSKNMYKLHFYLQELYQSGPFLNAFKVYVNWLSH